jgi:hypothetical protein
LAWCGWVGLLRGRIFRYWDQEPTVYFGIVEWGSSALKRDQLTELGSISEQEFRILLSDVDGVVVLNLFGYRICRCSKMAVAGSAVGIVEELKISAGQINHMQRGRIEGGGRVPYHIINGWWLLEYKLGQWNAGVGSAVCRVMVG